MLYGPSSRRCCSFLSFSYRSNFAADTVSYVHLCSSVFSKNHFRDAVYTSFSTPSFYTLRHDRRFLLTPTGVPNLSFSRNGSHLQNQHSNEVEDEDNIVCYENEVINKNKVSEKQVDVPTCHLISNEGDFDERTTPHEKTQEGMHSDLKSYSSFNSYSEKRFGERKHNPGSAERCSALYQPYSLRNADEMEVNKVRDNYEKKAEVLKEIARITHRELRAEALRDAKDGNAAIPPLTPIGWSVEHDPGTRFFFMRKNIPYFSSDGSSRGDLSFRERKPQFRSILEEALQRHQESNAREDKNSGRNGSRESKLRKKYLREYLPHRGTDLQASMSSLDSSHYQRLDTQLTLYVPFQVQDLSLVDPTIPITEWCCFDLYVRKIPSSLACLLPHQRRVWDDRECMIFRLASVQSELRIRSVQFLSRQTERKLGESAAFGQGDPLWLAVNARRRQHQQRRAQAEQQERSMTGTDSPKKMIQKKPLTALYTDPRMTLQFLDDQTQLGDFARSMVYHGPHCSSLSAELQDGLLQYLSDNLGINNEVVEYVCQMQYFIEQEEYMGWLARLGLAVRRIRARIQQEKN